MMTKLKKLCIFVLFVVIISLCGMYSLGVFDICFLESVTEKNYNLGEFFYTGELLHGKFQNNGIIKLNDGAIYSGKFKNGGMCGDFTYYSKNNWSMRGIFENENLVMVNLTTDQK